MGFSLINKPFWGTPIYGNPHINWWFGFRNHPLYHDYSLNGSKQIHNGSGRSAMHFDVQFIYAWKSSLDLQQGRNKPLGVIPFLMIELLCLSTYEDINPYHHEVPMIFHVWWSNSYVWYLNHFESIFSILGTAKNHYPPVNYTTVWPAIFRPIFPGLED